MADLTKRSYTSPLLVEFGSVRNLTGGSQNCNMDAMSTMSATPFDIVNMVGQPMCS